MAKGLDITDYMNAHKGENRRTYKKQDFDYWDSFVPGILYPPIAKERIMNPEDFYNSEVIKAELNSWGINEQGWFTGYLPKPYFPDKYKGRKYSLQTRRLWHIHKDHAEKVGQRTNIDIVTFEKMTKGVPCFLCLDKRSGYLTRVDKEYGFSVDNLRSVCRECYYFSMPFGDIKNFAEYASVIVVRSGIRLDHLEHL